MTYVQEERCPVVVVIYGSGVGPNGYRLYSHKHNPTSLRYVYISTNRNNRSGGFDRFIGTRSATIRGQWFIAHYSFGPKLAKICSKRILTDGSCGARIIRYKSFPFASFVAPWERGFGLYTNVNNCTPETCCFPSRLYMFAALKHEQITRRRKLCTDKKKKKKNRPCSIFLPIPIGIGFVVFIDTNFNRIYI